MFAGEQQSRALCRCVFTDRRRVGCGAFSRLLARAKNDTEAGRQQNRRVEVVMQ
jgi:hypothetical protein